MKTPKSPKIPILNLAIIGDSNSGKTSLLNKYLQKTVEIIIYNHRIFLLCGGYVILSRLNVVLFQVY